MTSFLQLLRALATRTYLIKSIGGAFEDDVPEEQVVVVFEADRSAEGVVADVYRIRGACASGYPSVALLEHS